MFRRTTCRNMSVAVFGSSTLNYFTGPLILLLKTHPIVTKLVQVCESLRCDLMQTATHCQMLSEVEGNLKNVDIIVVAPAQPADVPIIVSQFSNSLRESMQSRNNTKVPPIILVTSPTSSINTLTPLVHKYLLLQGIAIPKHCVMGSVTLHTMRSRVALSTYLGKNPFDIDVSVIGGATPTTCIPQFAAFEHHFGFSRSMSEQLTYATTLVTNSETNGMGYAEAYANGELIVSILRGLRGDPSVSECVYTENILQEGEDKLFRSLSKQPDESENEKSDYCPEFFTRRVVFGERGIEEFLPLGKLSDLETKLLGESLETLKKDIQYAKCFEPEAICK